MDLEPCSPALEPSPAGLKLDELCLRLFEGLCGEILENPELSAVDARFVWVRVIDLMHTSLMLELQQEVLIEAKYCKPNRNCEPEDYGRLQDQTTGRGDPT